MSSLQQALQHLHNGRWQAAEQLCLTLCQTSPPPADALHVLAVLYAQNKRLALAEAYFQQAIALAPERADFYGNYANFLWESDRVAETIACCQQAIARHCQRPEVFNTLGNGYFRLGEFAAATTNYRLALDLQPRYAEAHNNLGQALKAQQDYLGAEQCFRAAIHWQPGFALAESNLLQVKAEWLTPLCGKRIMLRRANEHDAAYLLSCYQNAAFMRNFNQFMPAYTLESLTAILQTEAKQHPSQLGALSWLLLTKQRLRPVGIVNLVNIHLTHRRAELQVGVPDPADRYFGSATEASLLAMDFAFNVLHLNKLVTTVYTDNSVSQKNIHALGFRLEGVMQEHLFNPDTQAYLDVYSNAMSQAAFRRNGRLSRLSQRLLGHDITGITGNQGTHPSLVL